MRNADASMPVGVSAHSSGGYPPVIGLDCNDLLGGLTSAPAVVVAVSGGPDSMALMHLVARWLGTATAPVPEVHIATVDHGLRSASRCEALMVAETAGWLGLRHAILTWQGPKPSTRIQERARTARYRLLADHARSVRATVVLTAHHADDQAETILLRLGRGSGIGGLCGMGRESRLAPGLVLTRPLLDIPKADLVSFCRRLGQSYIEDPSNSDPAFGRGLLRAQTEVLAAVGLDTRGMTRLARRMARANEALEAATTCLEASLRAAYAEGSFRARLDATRPAEAEILLRLLHRAIRHVAPDRPAIKLGRLETLTTCLAGALRDGRHFSATLGGTVVVLGRDAVISVSREPERRRPRAAREGPCRH